MTTSIDKKYTRLDMTQKQEKAEIDRAYKAAVLRYEIGPCPSCGWKPALSRYRITDRKGEPFSFVWRFCCRNCHTKTKDHATVEGALLDWNGRGLSLSDRIRSKVKSMLAGAGIASKSSL